MARRLFEMGGIRRSNGQLASGSIYLVYTDEAGTTLADISATAEGTSIAGSTVTTTDITGLGPSALRFYGPDDATDVLYLRSYSDAGLGVQKFEASTDPRLDRFGRWYVDAADFVHPDDDGDDALALQRAIDYAQTLVVSATGVPTVILTGDEYHWLTPITLKSAPVKSLTSMNNGCKVKWDGTAGVTAMTKDTSFPGGNTYGGLENITFTEGATVPGTWLALPTLGVDAGYRLKELQFGRCSSDAITIIGWANCHWEHLRFDNVCGYAIRLTPGSSQTVSSFVLDGFTYDHHPLSGTPANGMILIDNSANASNLGVFALKNARIEINTDWGGQQAVVTLKVPDVAPQPRSIGIYLENISYSDVSVMANDVLLYHDTAATNLVPTLILVNVRLIGMSALIGGPVLSTQALPALQSNYGFLVIGNGGQSAIADTLRLLTTTTTNSPLTLRAGSDTQDRFALDQTGRLNWGSGSAVADTSLERVSADVLRTPDALRVEDALQIKATSGAPTDADFLHTPSNASLAADTTGHGLYLRSGGTWRLLTTGLIDVADPGTLYNGSPTRRQSIPRFDAKDNVSVLTAGVMLLAGVGLFAGDVVTSLSFCSGATALVQGSNNDGHWWFALYDANRNLLSQSADQTTTAWAANTVKTLALGTPQTIATDGWCYAAVMVEPGTGGSPAVPSMRCCAIGLAQMALGTGWPAGAKQLAGTNGSGLTATAPAGPVALSDGSTIAYCMTS